MASFTSKATGFWWSAGQTTWNEFGIPGVSDTVSIASPHVITLHEDARLGDSSLIALTIAEGGELALLSNVVLTVAGEIINSGSIDLGDNASLVTDADFAALAAHFPKVTRPRPFAPGLAR